MQQIEDIGILSYMRRNGLEKESDKFNMAQTIKEFNERAKCHPVLQENEDEKLERANFEDKIQKKQVE